MGSALQPPRPPPDLDPSARRRADRDPWIHRDHAHAPFNDHTWQHVRAVTGRHGDRDTHEAALADALDQLMRRARAGAASRTEQALLARTTARSPTPPHPPRTEDGQHPDTPIEDDTGTTGSPDSLDDLDEVPDESAGLEEDISDDAVSPAAGYTGLGLFDAQEEAMKW